MAAAARASGNIGSELFRLATPFQMRHIACDPYVTQESVRPLGVTLVDTDTLFREADFLFEREFRTQRQQHCPIEPHVTICWLDADGRLVIRKSGTEPLIRVMAEGDDALLAFVSGSVVDDIADAKSDVEGLILHKHGIFTFGENAREAYERMIEMVSLAESRLRQERPIVFPARQIASAVASAAVTPVPSRKVRL